MSFEMMIRILEVCVIPIAVALLGGNIIAKYLEDQRLRKNEQRQEYKSAAERCQKHVSQWKSVSDNILILSVGFLSGKTSYLEFFFARKKAFEKYDFDSSVLRSDLLNYFPDAVEKMNRCVEANSAVSNIVHRHKAAVGESGIGKYREYDDLIAQNEEIQAAYDDLQATIGQGFRKML